MVKWYSSLWETHLKSTEHHLPYGITRVYLAPDYLPPDTGKCVLHNFS